MESIFAIGLALGLTAESSGLAVVEGVDASESNSYRAREMHLRHLWSFPPGTSYMDIIKYISELLKKMNIRYLVVDQTAVGAAIVKMFREELGMSIYPVIVGTRRSEHYSEGVDYLPKQDVIGLIIVALEKGQ